MQFHLLREEPVHSGSFARTGETIEGDANAAMLRCVALSADGSRYAVYPYEAIRQDAPVPAEPAPVNPPAPDAAATMMEN